MKIRIKGNSLRYRLTQTEVRTLADQGAISETTTFAAGQVLTYAIETRTDLENLDAEYQQHRIVLLLPETWAKNWPQEDRVGFSHTKPLTPDTSLFLLLEKDFVCLDEVAEDQSDNYPNPRYEKKDGTTTTAC